MKIKKALFYSSLVVFFLFSLVLFFYTLVQTNNTEKEWNKLLIKEKIALVKHEILPFLMEGKFDMFPSFSLQKFSFPFAVKKGNSILYFNKNKKLSSKEKLPVLKRFYVYKTNLKSPYSNYVWGQLIIYQKKTPFFLLSLHPYKVFLFFIIITFFLFLTFSIFTTFRTFNVEKKKFLSFLPISQKIDEEYNKIKKEIKRIKERKEHLLQEKDEEIEEIEQEFNNLKKKIKALTKIKKNLFETQKNLSSHNAIIGIAHEVNNPLTTIIGYLQLLSTEKNLSDKNKNMLLKNVEKIFKTKEKLEKLISASPEKTKERVNLKETLSPLKKDFPFLKIQAERDILFTGNKEKTKKTFSQLLKILEKYSPKAIDISTSQKKEKILITIEARLKKPIKDELSIRREIIDFVVFFEIYGKIKISLSSPHQLKIFISFTE